MSRNISMSIYVMIIYTSVAHASGEARTAKGYLRDAYTHVQVTVDGDIARTEVTQVFVNDLPAAAEATYSFPLPADAAVTGFADWRDGKRVEARADDRDRATKEYESAVEEGKKASLAESDGQSRFKMRLGTIPAHGTRRIELRYNQTLSALGGERSYVFPAGKGEGTAPTLLDVDVSLVGDRALTQATSLNHTDARVEKSGNGYGVHLSRTHEGLERDLALRWMQESLALDLAARAVRVKPGEPAYVETRLAFNQDPTPLLRQPTDVVLVMDTSMSMAGEPLERARELAASVLGGLGPADRINLVTFADGVSTLHERLQVADRDHLALVREAVSRLSARGRSNLEAALDEAALLLKGSPRGLMVLMTDGQPTVGDDFEKPAAVRADFEKTRVVVAHFNYPSRRSALEALFPSVTTEYVPDGPAGADAVARLARLAVAPSIEQLKLEVAGGASVEGGAPTRLAVGESVRLMARADADVMIRLDGTLHDRPFHLEQRVVVPAAPDGRGDRGLPVEWARLRVRNLETRLDGGGSAEQSKAWKDEIRSLGKQYGLVTRFTSFVVTDDSLSPDRIKPGDPEIRIHAPRSAQGVRAVLPWGEVVECAWQPDEQLWLGRFLVPRGTPDGLYRVRVFVDEQGLTSLRNTLFFMVDSKPPQFVLTREGSGPLGRGDRVVLVARVKEGVFDRSGDVIVRDRIDLKKIAVTVGAVEVPLARVGDSDVWRAEVPVELDAGRHRVTLTAIDFALNASQATLDLDVR
jgi:Ca-activated chloride channel family protein